MIEPISIKTTQEAATWAFASTAAVAFGWRGGLALIWIASMILDYATGTFSALSNGEWTSTKARQGLFHKGGMLAVVIAAILLDLLIRTIQHTGIVSFPCVYSAVLMPVVMAGYIVTEIGSSIENVSAMGVYIPPILLRAMESVKNTVQSEAEKGEADNDETDQTGLRNSDGD